MRQANVLFKDDDAGTLTQHDDGTFTFRYEDSWIVDSNRPGISLTLPKKEHVFHSKFLFPFFYNMLPEGTNKQVVCKHHRIDLSDHLSLLMISAKYDSIGAVRVVKIEEP